MPLVLVKSTLTLPFKAMSSTFIHFVNIFTPDYLSTWKESNPQTCVCRDCTWKPQLCRPL
uniref:Uncharacterized protein n=1 Tax=Lates calcarifer TaxID=8187 RepID=A0A4W6FRS0_LATCA